MIIHFWWFLEHLVGADNSSGPAYLFWSGIVGDFGLLGVFALAYRKLNCHQPGCWRMGHHGHDNGKYHYCRRHHPDMIE